jgi:anti-sigma B factor antagonist
MESTIQQHGNHTIVTIEGEVDYFHLSQFKELMKPLVEGSYESIIIDLRGVSFMDSSGIGVLVTSHKKMQKKDCHFALLNIPSDIMTLLKLGTIEKFLTIYDSVDEIPV